MIKSMLSTQLIKTLWKKIQKINRNIENSLSFLTAQNLEFINNIEKLERAKKKRKNIIVLEDKLEDLLKSNRKTNFEIENVPKYSNETKDEIRWLTASRIRLNVRLIRRISGTFIEYEGKMAVLKIHQLLWRPHRQFLETTF